MRGIPGELVREPHSVDLEPVARDLAALFGAGPRVLSHASILVCDHAGPSPLLSAEPPIAPWGRDPKPVENPAQPFYARHPIDFLRKGTAVKRSKPGSALVVGASGYVGRGLVPALAEAGFSVVATGFANLASVAAGKGIDARPLDVRDGPAVRALVDEVRPEVLFDCTTVSRPELLVPVVVDGARRLATAAAACDARHILLSTDNVFDGATGWYAEEDPICPVNAYGRAKAAAEALVLRLARHPVIVRTSLVSGLEPLDPRSRWVVDALARGEDVALFTDEFRCPIWIEDLVAALLELTRTTHRGPLHVVGPERLSRYDIGALLAAWLGLPQGHLKPALAGRSGMNRTLDGSLATARSRQILKTVLRGFETRLLPLIEGQRPEPVSD